MELYKELILQILKNEKISISFPSLEINIKEIVNLKSYKALEKIKDIIRDDTLQDKECFMKIEEIICLLEDLGIDCGNRHDFG